MASMPKEGMSFNPIKQAKRFYKFIMYDIPGILYDHEQDGNAYLSLPRLIYGIAGLLVVIAYVREHFFGIKYENFLNMIGFFTAAAGGYIGKRFASVSSAKHKKGETKNVEV